MHGAVRIEGRDYLDLFDSIDTLGSLRLSFYLEILTSEERMRLHNFKCGIISSDGMHQKQYLLEERRKS